MPGYIPIIRMPLLNRLSGIGSGLRSEEGKHDPYYFYGTG